MSTAMFLKIDGIDGESTDKKHEKWIEVQSFAHGLSQMSTGVSATGGLPGGRADFQNLVITKIIDNSTADLNVKCAGGDPIPKIELECCLATGEKHTFMKYTLEKCIITSVQAGGGSGSELKPTESVSFAYGKIKWEYTPIDSDGKAGSATDRTWDLMANEKA
jgi:type VI secretion system secreted protein Hcp